MHYYDTHAGNNRLVLEYLLPLARPSPSSTSPGSSGAERLSEPQMLTILRQMLEALQHLLTGNGILHCDVRPQNILSTKDGVAKLSSFQRMRKGLMLLKQTTLPVIPTYNKRSIPSASKPYCAPEVLQAGRYSPQSDLWSLGCTIVFLLAGEEISKEVVAAASARTFAEESFQVPTSLLQLQTQELGVLLRAWLDPVPENRGTVAKALRIIPTEKPDQS